MTVHHDGRWFVVSATTSSCEDVSVVSERTFELVTWLQVFTIELLLRSREWVREGGFASFPVKNPSSTFELSEPAYALL